MNDYFNDFTADLDYSFDFDPATDSSWLDDSDLEMLDDLTSLGF